MYYWYPAPLGLLCRALRDRLPAFFLVLRFLCVQLHYAIFHRNRNDLVHSELYRLLDHGFHSVALRQCLKQKYLCTELCSRRLGI